MPPKKKELTLPKLRAWDPSDLRLLLDLLRIPPPAPNATKDSLAQAFLDSKFALLVVTPEEVRKCEGRSDELAKLFRQQQEAANQHNARLNEQECQQQQRAAELLEQKQLKLKQRAQRVAEQRQQVSSSDSAAPAGAAGSSKPAARASKAPATAAQPNGSGPGGPHDLEPSASAAAPPAAAAAAAPAGASKKQSRRGGGVPPREAMMMASSAVAGPSTSATVAQPPRNEPSSASVPALDSPPFDGDDGSTETPKLPCVLLGVCGHDASNEQVPKLVAGLLEFAQVKVVSTPAVEGSAPNLLSQLEKRGVEVYTEDDRRLFPKTLSATLASQADVLLVAPLSLDTLAEMANGLETNLLTVIARYWETEPLEGHANTRGTPLKPFIVVPAAPFKALRHPTTMRHWTQLRDLGVSFLGMGDDQPPLARGTRVQLSGLEKRADLNGTMGVVQDFSHGEGWYTVRLDATGQSVSIRPPNLTATDAMTADLDNIFAHVKHAIAEESELHGFGESEQQPKRQRQR